jgi:hypothetical protein
MPPWVLATELFVPTSCPRAKPLERLCGVIPDPGGRNHTRKRFSTLIKDIERSMQEHGPWQYQLSQIYYEPAITAAVESMAAEATSQIAA